MEVLPERDVFGTNIRMEKSGESYIGMFDQEYALHKYTFPDGRVFYEAVQASPWSSGPCFFLALKDERGEWVGESLWSEEEIENA